MELKDLIIERAMQKVANGIDKEAKLPAVYSHARRIIQEALEGAPNYRAGTPYGDIALRARDLFRRVQKTHDYNNTANLFGLPTKRTLRNSDLYRLEELYNNFVKRHKGLQEVLKLQSTEANKIINSQGLSKQKLLKHLQTADYEKALDRAVADIARNNRDIYAPL